MHHLHEKAIEGRFIGSYPDLSGIFRIAPNGARVAHCSEHGSRFRRWRARAAIQQAPDKSGQDPINRPSMGFWGI